MVDGALDKQGQTHQSTLLVGAGRSTRSWSRLWSELGQEKMLASPTQNHLIIDSITCQTDCRWQHTNTRFCQRETLATLVVQLKSLLHTVFSLINICEEFPLHAVRSPVTLLTIKRLTEVSQADGVSSYISNGKVKGEKVDERSDADTTDKGLPESQCIPGVS